ncbi:hypothetical protein M407DRAFT_241319 [Tulasnella calospora MUT 4182]|uniref:Uncharacterized protein n=1 Tax=Tulasnella calospora MUT 4182 TaxID=1051891 RepID=A0A0C3QJR9_9AGAM|nr:hypothetical protein M407DRAFT_241319 [Tulasnella calospora MUT 4182]
MPPSYQEDCSIRASPAAKPRSSSSLDSYSAFHSTMTIGQDRTENTPAQSNNAFGDRGQLLFAPRFGTISVRAADVRRQIGTSLRRVPKTRYKSLLLRFWPLLHPS